ncbi:MAG: hypothetical protein NWE80_02595 [Candidatus Bathyarchaeota archaeon]|nr:hypothetical protein [Candidatus Bathyarchaeota archaeon]
MEKPPGKPRIFTKVFLVAVVAVAALVVYAALTYPKTAISFPVSFIIGANLEDRELDISPLHGWAQVEVIVNSGTALWSATIKHQDETVWDHRASQGGQTIYKSSWIELSGGQYNFAFATAGFGELNADVKVTTKGGFW